MSDPIDLLNGIRSDEIRERLDRLHGEERALRVLLRAAVQRERVEKVRTEKVRRESEAAHA